MSTVNTKNNKLKICSSLFVMTAESFNYSVRQPRVYANLPARECHLFSSISCRKRVVSLKFKYQVKTCIS